MSIHWQKLLKSWTRPIRSSRRRSLQDTIPADVWHAESLEERSFPTPVAFDAPVQVNNAGLPPKDVAVGDLDGDGQLDLVVGRHANNLKVFWGDGRGGFGANPTLLSKPTTNPLANAPLIADFNGDGRLDVMIAETFTGAFQLYAGNGTRNLAAPVSTSVSGFVAGLNTEDFNGDGARDVLVSSVYSDGYNPASSRVVVYLNDRRGGFSLATQPITLSSNDVLGGGSAATGDVTGDGRADVVVARTDNVLTLLVGNGNGSFQAPQTINRSNSRGFADVHLADVNGDRKLDVVLADSNVNAVWVGLGNGNRQFSFQSFGVGDKPVRLAIGDVDGDGRADIVTANPGTYDAGSSTRGDTITLLKGLGNGQFEAGQDFVTGNRSTSETSPSCVVLADLNRDGLLDLIVGHGYSNPANSRYTPASSSVTVLKARPATPAGGTLAGQVFVDTNGNGSRNSGEAGLGSRTVYLDANNNGRRDTGERSATTDAAGNYSFTGLAAGTYVIAEELPSGWSQTLPTSNGRFQVQLTTGQSRAGFDFGNFQVMTIRGTIFDDTNFNFQRDTGEAGLSGWWVILDSNRNNQWDPGELMARTDSAGNYTLSGLGVGQPVPDLGPGLFHHLWVMSPTGGTFNGRWFVDSRSGATVANRDFPQHR